jgi:divalent metal cation (Fe/Co/Zn/Cd) transporter
MGNPSETDLSHSITHHPHPFHLHQERDPRSLSRVGTPVHSPSPVPSSKAVPSQDKATLPEATTTAVDSNIPLDDLNHVTRHITGHTLREGRKSDEEDQRDPVFTNQNDPYQLASRLKSDSEIQLIRANQSKKRAGGKGEAISLLTSNGRKAKKIQDFYESQNESIQRLLKSVDEHVRDAKDTQGDTHLKYKIAVNGSFAANVLLAILQVYGAVSSGSLSLFTTMADALFDPMSNITLILANRAVNRVDPRRFPSGKARIETAGNIVFCFIMCTVSAIIIVLSVRELATHKDSDLNKFHLPSVIAVAVAFCTKLALFCYCWAIRDVYSQVRILWEDHRNDLFINGFGILTSVGGSKLKWWIDPMGAIVLSCLIIGLWLRTAYSEFMLLIGVTADTSMQQLITYIGKHPLHCIPDICLLFFFHRPS